MILPHFLTTGSKALRSDNRSKTKAMLKINSFLSYEASSIIQGNPTILYLPEQQVTSRCFKGALGMMNSAIVLKSIIAGAIKGFGL